MNYYVKLKEEMRKQEISQTYLAELLRVSRPYIASRFKGEMPWNSDEMYTILKVLRIPPEQMSIYFPPGGIEVKSNKPKLEEVKAEPAKATIENTDLDKIVADVVNEMSLTFIKLIKAMSK